MKMTKVKYGDQYAIELIPLSEWVQTDAHISWNENLKNEMNFPILVDFRRRVGSMKSIWPNFR